MRILSTPLVALILWLAWTESHIGSRFFPSLPSPGYADTFGLCVCLACVATLVFPAASVTQNAK